MSTPEELRVRRKQLKKEITGNLDLLIGHLRRSPSMKRPSMTLKVSGKTVTRYVRKHLIAKAKKMNENHRRARELITELSEVNWELLNLEAPGK